MYGCSRMSLASFVMSSWKKLGTGSTFSDQFLFLCSGGTLSHVTVFVYNKMKFEKYFLYSCQCYDALVSKVTLFKLSLYFSLRFVCQTTCSVSP